LGFVRVGVVEGAVLVVVDVVVVVGDVLVVVVVVGVSVLVAVVVPVVVVGVVSVLVVVVGVYARAPEPVSRSAQAAITTAEANGPKRWRTARLISPSSAGRRPLR
jgi:hypothetical protein